MAHHAADASARASTSRISTCWSMSTSGPPQDRGMGMRKTPLSHPPPPDVPGCSDGSGGELGGDGSAVQPDVLAADLAVPEIPDMQHPETDRAAVAGDAHKGPRERPVQRTSNQLRLVSVGHTVEAPRCEAGSAMVRPGRPGGLTADRARWPLAGRQGQWALVTESAASSVPAGVWTGVLEVG